MGAGVLAIITVTLFDVFCMYFGSETYLLCRKYAGLAQVRIVRKKSKNKI